MSGPRSRPPGHAGAPPTSGAAAPPKLINRPHMRLIVAIGQDGRRRPDSSEADRCHTRLLLRAVPRTPQRSASVPPAGTEASGAGISGEPHSPTAYRQGLRASTGDARSFPPNLALDVDHGMDRRSTCGATPSRLVEERTARRPPPSASSPCRRVLWQVRDRRPARVRGARIGGEVRR